MIKLKKLYAEPAIFDPISFEYGVNIIMGESSESSDKKIGVGKSICIEFLHYCLLKKYSESRLALIPKNVIEPDTKIKLDLDFNTEKLTIIREFNNPKKVTIFKNGEEIIFSKIDDSSEFLSNLYFKNYPSHIKRISFRNLLHPIIRDERSEFKDIIQCFDTRKRIPKDYKPHLFFLNFDIDKYNRIGKTINDLKNKRTFLSETRKILTNNKQRKVTDAKARLNELDSEVLRINESIEKLKNNESFQIIQLDLVKLESELKKLRAKQKALQYDIRQIESLPEPENISGNEMVILFNQFKKGLGDLVEKSIEEVKQFKYKIDNFRSTLVNKRLDSLKSELVILNTNIRELDEQNAEMLKLLDENGEFLKDLRTSLKIYESKNRELNNLRTLVERYEKTERDKKLLTTQKSNEVSELDKEIFEKKETVESFKNTLLEFHQKIMGNREAHFEIKTTSRKEFITFILRTDDDGSHTTERMKVFLYDMALLFNENTKKNHPSFLIHDNLFDKDDDSLEKSLNFLHKQEQNYANEFQYILTLNRDMVDALEHKKLLNFNINNNIRASFTKDERFLKKKYTEVRKRK
ncbi:MAG: DUF2326 domain-containing protein [Chitinophagales bacterium]